MSKSSNKQKVECLMVYFKTLKRQSKPRHLKEDDEKSDFRVEIKGMKKR